MSDCVKTIMTVALAMEFIMVWVLYYMTFKTTVGIINKLKWSKSSCECSFTVRLSSIL